MATRPPDHARPVRGALRLVTDALADQVPEEQPLAACTLGDGDAFAARIEAVRQLFATCTAVEELPDGYAFRFAGDDGIVAALLAFVAAERRCCRFLTYDLACTPDLGFVVLRLRGTRTASGSCSTRSSRRPNDGRSDAPLASSPLTLERAPGCIMHP